MQQYVYGGKNEQNLYLKEPTDDYQVGEPFGVIVVPKDYDTCWIAYRNYYLGWKVIVAPVTIQYIKSN